MHVGSAQIGERRRRILHRNWFIQHRNIERRHTLDRPVGGKPFLLSMMNHTDATNYVVMYVDKGIAIEGHTRALETLSRWCSSDYPYRVAVLYDKVLNVCCQHSGLHDSAQVD